MKNVVIVLAAALSLANVALAADAKDKEAEQQIHKTAAKADKKAPAAKTQAKARKTALIDEQ